jgi:hypothetical protein
MLCLHQCTFTHTHIHTFIYKHIHLRASAELGGGHGSALVSLDSVGVPGGGGRHVHSTAAALRAAVGGNAALLGASDLYVCECVCVCVHVCGIQKTEIFVCFFVCGYTYVCLCVDLRICVCVWMYVRLTVCGYMYVCVWICVCLFMCGQIGVSTVHIKKNMLLYARVNENMHAHTHTPLIISVISHINNVTHKCRGKLTQLAGASMLL